jgi:hypothetical protein
MSSWRDDPVIRHDVVTIPVVWLAFVLSLLVHVTALWIWLPQIPFLSPGAMADSSATGALTVQLTEQRAERSSPPANGEPEAPVSQARIQPVPSRRSPPPRPEPRPAPTPPLLALTPKSPVAPALPTPPPAAAPRQDAAPVGGDLASYIEARRRARGEPDAPAAPDNPSITGSGEDENARRNRIIAANLAATEAPTFGYDPKTGGGLFQLQHVGYDEAEFYFSGWDKDIRRRAKELIEVRKGANSDIRIAVVRKMIEIIRAHESGDFVWLSAGRTRETVLSARPEDTAALEEFMMREFFSAAQARQ